MLGRFRAILLTSVALANNWAAAKWYGGFGQGQDGGLRYALPT
jgi:hypothetical protein